MRASPRRRSGSGDRATARLDRPRVASAESVAWLEAGNSSGNAPASMNANWGSRSASPPASSGAPILPSRRRNSASAQRLAPGMAAASLDGGRGRSRGASARDASRRRPQAFAARVERLCVTAEVTEHIAYLKGFAIFPAGAALHGRAREGVRSSIALVFQAIACHNPYPSDYFDEAGVEPDGGQVRVRRNSD